MKKILSSYKCRRNIQINITINPNVRWNHVVPVRNLDLALQMVELVPRKVDLGLQMVELALLEIVITNMGQNLGLHPESIVARLEGIDRNLEVDLLLLSGEEMEETVARVSMGKTEETDIQAEMAVMERMEKMAVMEDQGKMDVMDRKVEQDLRDRKEIVDIEDIQVQLVRSEDHQDQRDLQVHSDLPDRVEVQLDQQDLPEKQVL
jgi:hypothetical protein